MVYRLPPPECEHTEDGAETEALDCWAIATKRHTEDGITVGVFCADHSADNYRPGLAIEDIPETPAYDIAP